MTENVRTILIPHDGSALSSRSAETLAPLLLNQPNVVLLYIDDGHTVDEDALAAAAEVLEAKGASVTRRDETSNDVAGTILDVAAELQPDLVAMSTHGHGGIERFTRGSVAERVLRSCPAPLLMTNPFTEGDAGGVDSVLVPLDGSEDAGSVLDSAIPIARAFSARVVLLYVDWSADTDTPGLASKRREMREADIEGWLASARDRVVGAGLDVTIEVAYGNVAQEVLRLAAPGVHGLLAMATHGRSGPGRWLLGSTAETVLRECRIPVLLHRIGAAAIG